MKLIRVPRGLKAAGKKFWKKVLSEYELQDSHDLERLAMACKCLDDLVEIEERVETDGRFVKNRYGTPVEHPGCKMIRDNRMLFIKIIRETGLDLTTVTDARPPRQY
jgi:P27 family predicted phage terminase small subunit